MWSWFHTILLVVGGSISGTNVGVHRFPRSQDTRKTVRRKPVNKVTNSRYCVDRYLIFYCVDRYLIFCIIQDLIHSDLHLHSTNRCKNCHDLENSDHIWISDRYHAVRSDSSMRCPPQILLCNAPYDFF